MEEEMEICSNCKREIRSVNYVTHSVHCHRNIVICNKCNEPVPRAELAAHDANEHQLRSCSACGAQVEKALMQKHAKEDCPQRKITCSFCELELQAKEAIEHESYCGTRTEKCAECGEFVMLKYQALHLDSNHGFLKLEDEPGPPASWEAPVVKAATSRPILKSAIRPASSIQAASAKKSVPNTVRFAPIEKPLPAEVPAPAEKPKERQTRFSNNKIGAEVKPIVANVKDDSVVDQKVPVHDEEADRLLAFKLAQDEMEMMSKYQLDGILQQRRKAIEASEKSKGSVTESIKAVKLEDSPQPYDNMGAVGGKFKKQKSPEARELDNEPSPSVREEPRCSDDGYEDVQIPCEFCETLIPASRLLIHQTGCRPDLACYIPYRPNKTCKLVHKTEHSTGEAVNLASTRTKTKTMIPCDLCHTAIQADMFIQHQLACEIKHLPARGSKPKALVMPLSGRTLRASQSIEESILPALEDLEKEAEAKPGLHPSYSAVDFTEMGRSSHSQNYHNETANDEEKKVKQGAVPKQKARSERPRVKSPVHPPSRYY